MTFESRIADLMLSPLSNLVENKDVVALNQHEEFGSKEIRE
jgi:hypothetical protein